MSSITESYIPPTWSARPNHEYYLEVLKNGILVDKSMINQVFLSNHKIRNLCIWLVNMVKYVI